MSQAWANKLVDKGAKSFNQDYKIDLWEHNEDANIKAGFGENIFYSLSDKAMEPQYVINLWYKQHRHYDFKAGAKLLSSSSTAKTGNKRYNMEYKFCPKL